MKLARTRHFKLFIGAISALALSGCATNTMTGRSQLMLVSETSAIAQSASAYTQMIGTLEKQGKLSTDEAVIKRIEDITNRLITEAIEYRPETVKWDWSMQVIDEPDTPNAFCMAGGKMAIYTGLTEKLKATDDELAQVIGHEIAHALASHSAEKMSVAMASNIGVAVLTVALGKNDRERQGIYNASGLAAMAIINLPNSRNAETEADKLGIELAARAGYAPTAAATLWKKMMEASGNKGRSDFLSTHPAPATRIDALRSLETVMTPIWEEGQKKRAQPPETWLNRPAHERVIKDNLNGDRPKQGKTFYSAVQDAFKKGQTNLTCESGCTPGFLLKQNSLKKHYEQQDWAALAAGALSTEIKLDLNYLYLGYAAKGQGLTDAAKRYFINAYRLSGTDNSCRKSFVISCQGFDVADTAATELHSFGLQAPFELDSADGP